MERKRREKEGRRKEKKTRRKEVWTDRKRLSLIIFHSKLNSRTQN